MLLQDADSHSVTRADLKVTERASNRGRIGSLLFAWKVCKHVKSNAIVYARNGQTGRSGRRPDEPRGFRKLGAMKAVLPLAGTVAASDAFFPFPGRSGEDRQGGRNRRDSAGRIGAGRGGDCCR